MNTSAYQTPDLASVLRTLAQYAPPAPQPIAVSQNGDLPDQAQAPNADIEEGEYEPFDMMDGTAEEHNLQPVISIPSLKRSHEQREAPAQVSTDPKTITDWPAALRHVMKTVARSDSIMARVKRMIKVQQEHEQQWWDGRQALLRKQEGREEGRKKLDEVLRSVGGNVGAGGTVTTPQDDQSELQRYDLKVHKASVDMVTAMTTELVNLGVPFFGISSDTLRKGQKAPQGYADGDDVVQKEARLGHDDLRKLQKRMLELLEDLCKE